MLEQKDRSYGIVSAPKKPATSWAGCLYIVLIDIDLTRLLFLECGMYSQGHGKAVRREEESEIKTLSFPAFCYTKVLELIVPCATC